MVRYEPISGTDRRPALDRALANWYARIRHAYWLGVATGLIALSVTLGAVLYFTR